MIVLAAVTACVEKRIPVGPGPEDFALQQRGPRGPRLIISSRDRRKDLPGRIQSLDLATHSVRDLTIHRGGPPLFPVGISLVETEEKTLLYVIHSRRKPRQQWVEVFRVDGDVLETDRSPMRDEAIKTPNDLIALPSGEIYLSNSGYGRSVIADTAATLMKSRRGNVVYFDGRSWSTFTGPLFFPNGLLVHDDRLFVAIFGRKRIEMYDRHAPKSLPAAVIPLGAHPDNLMWEESGKTIDVAAHRSMLRTGLHTASGWFSSPSVGYRVDIPSGEATKLYDLPDYNASSTALVIGDCVYVSQLLDDEIAVVKKEGP